MEHRGVHRRGPRGRGPHQQPLGRFRRRRRPLRLGLLRHLAGGSRPDGPPAAAARRGLLRGPGERGRAHRVAVRLADRCVRRHLHLRLRHRPVGRPRRHRRLHRHRQRAEHRREPPLLPAGPARPEHGRRLRLLLLAGGGAAGVREPGAGRVRPGRRRRRQPGAVPGLRHQLQQGRGDVRRRPLQAVRRPRRRLRALRGRRRGDPQAAQPGPGRRRPRARRDPRRRGGPGRREQRADGAQPEGPGGGGARRPCQGRGAPRRHRLRGGPRHRHHPRRPHRGQGARRGPR